MEQKKTLWIIAAVGAFLLVVLGAAAIVYSPAKNTSPTIASVAPVEKHNNTGNGWSNNSSENIVQTVTPVPVAKEVDEMVVVSENTTIYGLDQQTSTPTTTQAPETTTIDLNALKSELAAANAIPTTVQVPVQPQNINITVTLPEVEKPAPIVTEKPVPIQKTEKVLKAEQSSVKTSIPVKSAPAKVTEKKAVTTSATSKQAPKKVTQFWVQVASYSNKKGAENARTILDSNKISSDIFTYRDNKDKLYFRVRVGPYTTKSEAEYWQSRIMKIPYFVDNDSYITSTTK